MYDKKLSEFYFLCKEKYSNLEEWILQNKFFVNSYVCNASPTFSGFTPLHFAVKCNNLHAVKILLKHNADFTIKSTNGQTPLHLGMEMVMFNKNKFSRWEKNLQLILDEILFAHKSNPTNSVNNIGLSHFHIACYRDIEPIILKFLKNGVEINSYISLDSQYWAGFTPLHIATKYSYFNTVSLLLEHGANINVKNASGMTPFHCTIKKGNGLFVQLFQTVFNQNNLDTDDDENSSLLHVSCMAIDELYTLNNLLEDNKNVYISVRSDSTLWAGYTPLHVAIYYKRMYLAAILIQHGADINAKDINNITPFQLAIRKKLISSSLMSLILSKFIKIFVITMYDAKFYQLLTACFTDDYKIIKCILGEGFDVNYCVPLKYPINLPGYTLLHFAVEQEKIEIIELLLQNGANICAQDSTGLSPLHLAAQNGNFIALKKMLAFNLNTGENPIDSDGLSHLHIASLCNETVMVEILLKHKKIINLTTKAGETPLHYAVKFNAKNTVILLLKNKADFAIQEITLGLTPLHLAIEKKNEDIIDIILSYHSKRIVNPVSKDGLSHFHIFCMKNKVNLMKNFMKNTEFFKTSVKMNSKKFAGFTPLHFAVKYGSVECVKLLLDQDFDINAEDALNKISLHYINKLKPHTIQKVLYIFWSAVNHNPKKFINRYKISVLHLACMRDDYFSVINLLEHGFPINDCTSSDCPLWPKYSPLHFAVKYGSINTIKVLINSNANTNITDKYGFTPLHLGCSLSKKQIVEKLLSCGANPGVKSLSKLTPFRSAVQTKNDDIMKLILFYSSCKMVNPIDNKGLTYFHIACSRNLKEIVQNFVVNKVNINEQVHFFGPKFPGCTPLHIAVKKRYLEIIKILLKHGANVNIPDARGNTPLHLTCLPQAAYVKISNNLMKHGGNPNIKNAFGDTLMESAIKFNHFGILEEALKNGADPNINNCRSLDLAINLRREQMIDLLLINDADATIRFPDGKTFFHRTILNVKADETYYFKIFLRLLEHGCDLNSKDETGRAALHNSYWPVNMPGLKALLRCGADVDVEDRSGRTVVSYFLEITTSRMPRTELYRIFRKHLEARKYLGFELNQTNEDLYKTLLEHADDFLYVEENEKPLEAVEEVQKMKTLRFGGYASLYDMLKNKNLMARHLARNGFLRDFLKSSQFEEVFPQCGCVIMMQYGKALKRSGLMRQAIDAVNALLAREFEELRWNYECSEALIEFLNDDDLSNLGAVTDML